MNRCSLLCMLLALTFTTVVQAKPGIVTLKDGQKIEGNIERDNPEGVTINVRGIETIVGRERIESLVYVDSMKDQFAQRRSALKPDDATGHIALARWAFDNRLYAESRDVLDEVLNRIDPNNAEAAELRQLVQRQMQMERRTANQPPPTEDPAATPPAAGGRADVPAPNADNLLNNKQIMQVKILESNPQGEPGLRMNVSPELRRRITAADPNLTGRQFENASALQKLELITQHGTPEDLEAAALVGDPASIALFRQRIQPIILNGCASSGCHNTPEAGNFMLFERATNEQMGYTNFFILQQYRKQVPTPGGGTGIFAAENTTVKMIDRTRPRDSLLLQYLLPANVTPHPHPAANGFRPLARDINDPRYQQIIRWIASLNTIEPNYNIDYTPPQKSDDEKPAEDEKKPEK